MRQIHLPRWDMKIRLEGEAGSIVSSLSKQAEPGSHLAAAIDGIEALILCCAHNFVTIDSPEFEKAIEMAVDIAAKNWRMPPGRLKVVLTELQPNSMKIGIIKAIRQYSGLGLKEAKEITDYAGTDRAVFEIHEAQLDQLTKELRYHGGVLIRQSRLDLRADVGACLSKVQEAIGALVHAITQLNQQ